VTYVVVMYDSVGVMAVRGPYATIEEAEKAADSFDPWWGVVYELSAP
jgi:hypothetical protein